MERRYAETDPAVDEHGMVKDSAMYGGFLVGLVWAGVLVAGTHVRELLRSENTPQPQPTPTSQASNEGDFDLRN